MELFDSYDREPSFDSYIPPQDDSYNRWSDYGAVNDWANSMSQARPQDSFDGGSGGGGFSFDGFMKGNQGLFGSPGSWLSNATSAPSLWQLGTSIYSAMQANKAAKEQQAMVQKMMERSDPFGPQRAMYQQQLASAMTDPNAFANSPGYLAAMKSSEEAIRRQAAKSGYLGSGNLLNTISENAADQMWKYRDQELQRLAQLAGAQFGPNVSGFASPALDAINTKYNGRNQALGQIASSLGGNQYKF